MPRNRRSQAHDEKRDEIIAAATTMFVDGGYDATPMTRIASAARVAANTIYWYFKDKDELLVAVLDRVLARALADAAARDQEPWADQLLWAVGQLEQFHRLVTVVHARAATSPVVNDWHENFHRLVDDILTDGFRKTGTPEESLRAMTQVGVFVVEGLLLHPHSVPDRREIIELLTRPQRPPAALDSP